MTGKPGSPLKAVTCGVLVDVGGSIAAGLILTLVYAVLLASSGASAEDIQAALTAPQPAPWFSFVGFLAGSLAFDWDALMALLSMSAVFAGGWTGARRNRGAAR